MLHIAACKDVKCFDKAAIASGYKRTFAYGKPNNAMADYADNFVPKHGVPNRMSWAEKTAGQNVYSYVGFLFTNDKQVDAIAKELDQRYFKVVKTRQIGNPLADNFHLIAYYNKENVGVKTIMHEVKQNGKNVLVYVFAIIPNIPPGWPEVE